jgi:hypothetical protein
MNKIETIFDRDDRFRVTPKIRAGCEWVFEGEGFPTEKLDGTNVRITVTNHSIVKVEKRRNPTKAEKAQGQEPGYIDAHREDPQDKHIFAAVLNTVILSWPDGLYPCEAVGPKIQGNPLGLVSPVLYPFEYAPTLLPDMERSFESIKQYVLNLDSIFSPGHPAEGIVFHHQDGRMAKIKRKDF